MVEGHPKNHIAAAVVACRGEAFVAEDAHQLDQPVGYRPLRLLVVVGSHLRFARPAIPGHVGTDDTVAGCCQPGRDAMPGRARPGMTVDQQHRRTVTTKPHPQPGLAEIDHFVAEALEHVLDAIVLSSSPTPACSSWPSWSSTAHQQAHECCLDKVVSEFACRDLGLVTTGMMGTDTGLGRPCPSPTFRWSTHVHLDSARRNPRAGKRGAPSRRRGFRRRRRMVASL